jgi:ribosomal protein S18 acetylase RimI-like enzyme
LSAEFIEVGGPLDQRVATNLYGVVVAVVAGGGAIGWPTPPSPPELDEWLADLIKAVRSDDAAAVLVRAGTGAVLGFGYWRRYGRPTLRVNADIEKVFVAPAAQGGGIGAGIVGSLIDSARNAGIETLTLDVRADNSGALRLYQRLGFTEYGRLPAFVAFGPYRYDQVLLCNDLRHSRPTAPSG